MGREKTLEQLDKQLKESERVAISTLTGMGGIGKTELALQYALTDKDKDLEDRTYKSGICWINVSDQGDVGTQILNFAKDYLKISILEEGELENRVKHCWQLWGQEDILIIFDDVRQYKHIKDFLPPQEKKFKVIITTRKERLAESLKIFTLDVLDKKSALDLIISFIGEERVNEELDEARLLCQDLGYLPLGLELVSRFLKRRQNWSIKKYRDKLKDKGLKVRGIQESTEDMTAQRGVKAAFEISWQELEQEAQDIACYLSLFEVAPIPYQLIKELCPIQDEDDLEDILEDSLINLSLIKDLGSQVYEIHTLINRYLREKLSESNLTNEVKKAYCKLMVSVAKEIPEQPVKTDIQALTIKIPHLTVATKELNEWIEDEDLACPYVGISRFYEGQGFYKEAEPWRKQCLNIIQERLGEDHLSVASSLNNLAELYKAQGRYGEAEPLYLQALELRKKRLGEDHPDVASSLNNLAALYKAQGRYGEAEPLYLQAFELCKKRLGEDHPYVASSLNNLAELYKAQGRYGEAEPLYLQALELRKKRLGEDHPDVAQSLNNLAELYQAQGRYEKAEPLYLQALELFKKRLGKDHPDVATTLNNLVGLYRVQGRYEEAEPLYLQALELRKKRLREDHPDVATSLNNLAGLYQAQGRYEEAEPLYLQALELLKKRLGEDHPNTKTVKENYERMKEQME
ncbi:MAG: tetratricopeptide repeat protein [Crocosphaera sp.]|nr:tetratricopeptide repeat protein [Crocosphaera sp.]